MNIQKSIGDAVFYPSDPKKLHSLVTQTMDIAQSVDKIYTLPLAVISPHAAYTEVSMIMGKMYAELQHINPKHIVIIAPLHGDVLHEDADYTIFYPDAEAFSIPDSVIPIDQTILKKIDQTTGLLAKRTSYFEEEPAIELQLPYIYHLFRNHPVIPLLAGNPSAKTSRNLAKILGTFNPEETLFIVSTNLTGDLPTDRAKNHAETAVDILEGKHRVPLLETLKNKKISMCGTHILEALRKTGFFAENWKISGYHKTGLASAKRSTYSISAILPNIQQEELQAHD